MAEKAIPARVESVQAEKLPDTPTFVPAQPPNDKARTIPFQGPFTERERANALAVNEVWDVAHELERTQGDLEEYAEMLEEGRLVQETLHLVRRLPAICEDSRDRLMKAAQLMAEANGVRFRESQGRRFGCGKDFYMTVQASEARGEGFIPHPE
jgi:hypothetical protein